MATLVFWAPVLGLGLGLGLASLAPLVINTTELGSDRSRHPGPAPGVIVCVVEAEFGVTDSEPMLTATDEIAPDEASELITARERGPKKPVAGRPCAAWNFRST